MSFQMLHFPLLLCWLRRSVRRSTALLLLHAKCAGLHELDGISSCLMVTETGKQ